jgi:hypothetical protein
MNLIQPCPASSRRYKIFSAIAAMVAGMTAIGIKRQNRCLTVQNIICGNNRAPPRSIGLNTAQTRSDGKNSESITHNDPAAAGIIQNP